MGKKKDKAKKQGENRGADEEGVNPPTATAAAAAAVREEGEEEEVTDLLQQTQPATASSSRGAAKKGKRRKKKHDEEDWDDDMEALAREIDGVKLEDPPEGVVGPDSGRGQETQTAREEEEEEEEGGGGPVAGQSKPLPSPAVGKKAKKKKKQKQEDNWDEDIEAIAREIEEGVAPQARQTEPDKTQTEPGSASVGSEVKAEGPPVAAEGGTVMTPAQKRAAKKERERLKKKAKQQSQPTKTQETEPDVSKVEPDVSKVEPDVSKVEPDVSKTAPDVAKVEPDVSKMEPDVSELELPTDEPKVGGAEATVAGGDSEEDEEAEDKKKKKKKKKDKKKVAEEKSKGKKPGKAAILKMKEQVEALRAEQRRREEEEAARIRAEEEAEQKRLEELRLEQERKEKKKQKEKERKERRRLEGKPVTRAERERLARANQQLAAAKEQGVLVPERREEAGERRKVRYGSRQRPKKEKASAMTAESEAEPAASTGQEETTEGEHPTGQDEVKEQWDDESDSQSTAVEAEGVKDNWDDDSDHEGEEEEEDEGPAVMADAASQESQTKEQEEEEEEEGESSEEGSSESSSEEKEEEEELSSYDRAKQRIERRRVRHEEERSEDVLRSPVVCVLGHVDTGKTKILDKIRRTNVQDGEAGGITQQIGATFVPEDAIREQTKMLKEFSRAEIKLPGLLIIDTPGHESFSNLRSRGSSMCDLAILVVDLMHGLEPQTLESLGLLTKGGTPFIVALNKIDRLFDWQRNPRAGVKETLKRQKNTTREQFDERLQVVVTEFAEQGLNVALFWDKVDFSSGEYVPLVPTSAISGDGMGDLIALLVNYSQRSLSRHLRLSQEVEAIVMEVKVISGLGTTMDVILRNGFLQEGDTMVLTSSEGPFVTPVRALLMPQPLRELRVKNAYVNHKVILASQGIKVCAKDLDRVLAGTPVLVAKKQDEVDVLRDEAASAMKSALSAIQVQDRGVFVQASTLGSLEALVEFLKQSKIPYAGVNIGPVHKKDVMRASVMLEHDSQWAVILAFDVRVEREAQELADKEGVRIFTADIIYHLFDSFLKHRAELREQKRKEFESVAVFPCKLRILPDCVFNTRDPIIVGVVVEAGVLKQGTPITVPSKSFTDVGVVSSLEVNHKPVETAGRGKEVCIKIESTGGGAPRCYGRHFDYQDMLVSKISRESIDVVKKYFREDLHREDWQLIIELKKTFQIM